MMALTKPNQIHDQLYSANRFSRSLVYLFLLYGGLRLAPIKPVGTSDLEPTGMIVPFCRWFYD